MNFSQRSHFLLPILIISASFFSLIFFAQNSQSCGITQWQPLGYHEPYLPNCKTQNFGYCDGSLGGCFYYRYGPIGCVWFVETGSLIGYNIADCTDRFPVGYAEQMSPGRLTNQSTVVPPSYANGQQCIIREDGRSNPFDPSDYVGNCVPFFDSGTEDCLFSKCVRWDASQRSCVKCNNVTHIKTESHFCSFVVEYQNVFESACDADPGCDEKRPDDTCGYVGGIRATCNATGGCIPLSACQSDTDCAPGYACDKEDGNPGKCIYCSRAGYPNPTTNIEIRSSNASSPPDLKCDSAGNGNIPIGYAGYPALCNASQTCDEKYPNSGLTCINSTTLEKCNGYCQYSVVNCVAQYGAGYTCLSPNGIAQCVPPPGSFYFSMTSIPPITQTNPGDTVQYNISLTSLNSFTGTVSLSIFGSCPVASCTLSKSSVFLSNGGSNSSILTVLTNPSTVQTTYNITVRGAATAPSVTNYAYSLLVVADTIAPSVGKISPTSATQGISTVFQAPVSDNLRVAFCDFYWDGVGLGGMFVPPNQYGSTVTATFPYAPPVPGEFPAHATCQDTDGNQASGPDVLVNVSVGVVIPGNCNNNNICEVGETQQSCSSDCYTKVVMNPNYTLPNQSVQLIIEFYDGRYIAGHNSSYLLDIDGSFYWDSTNGCDLGNFDQINPSPPWPSYISYILSENNHSKLITNCTIPIFVTPGRHILTVTPNIYSNPTTLHSLSTEFTVSRTNSSPINFDFINQVAEFLKNVFLSMFSGVNQVV